MLKRFKRKAQEIKAQLNVDEKMNEEIKVLYLIILKRSYKENFLSKISDDINKMIISIVLLKDLNGYHSIPYNFPIQKESSVVKAREIFVMSYAGARGTSPFAVTKKMTQYYIK